MAQTIVKVPVKARLHKVCATTDPRRLGSGVALLERDGRADLIGNGGKHPVVPTHQPDEYQMPVEELDAGQAAVPADSDTRLLPATLFSAMAQACDSQRQ